jgi:hypothetical protein
MLHVPILSFLAFHLATCLLFMHSYGWFTLLLNPARFWSLFLALYLWWKAIKLNSLDFKWVLYILFFFTYQKSHPMKLDAVTVHSCNKFIFKYSLWLFCFFPVLFIGISRKPGIRIILRHPYQKPRHISPPFSVRLHFFCIDCTFNSRRLVDSIFLCLHPSLWWWIEIVQDFLQNLLLVEIKTFLCRFLTRPKNFRSVKIFAKILSNLPQQYY